MPPLPPGTPFPPRVLPRVGSGQFALADAWAGGPALVALGHAECDTTRLTLPFLDRIHRGKGPAATLVAVLQEDAAGAEALVRELGLVLPVCRDEEPYPLFAALGLDTVPTCYLVAEGGVVDRVLEGFDREALEQLAAALGASGPVFSPDDDAPARRPG